MQSHVNFNFDSFWNIKVLPSAQYFAWRILIGKITTYDNLISRGIHIGGSLCVMCGLKGECVNHLFYLYNVIQCVVYD